MTEAEYLEQSLQPERGVSMQVSQRNRIRLLLSSFFNERDCVALQRPLLDEADLVPSLQHRTPANLCPARFTLSMCARQGFSSSFLLFLYISRSNNVS